MDIIMIWAIIGLTWYCVKSLGQTLIATPKPVRRGKNWHRGVDLIERTAEATEFTSWTVCPRCDEQDVHWIELLRNDSRVKRQCRSCDFKWKQRTL